jgi:hypothetical protein
LHSDFEPCERRQGLLSDFQSCFPYNIKVESDFVAPAPRNARGICHY